VKTQDESHQGVRPLDQSGTRQNVHTQGQTEPFRNEITAGTTPLEKVTDADYNAPVVGPD
jgi:hypothetical protein